jgi:hypothetical protein
MSPVRRSEGSDTLIVIDTTSSQPSTNTSQCARVGSYDVTVGCKNVHAMFAHAS